MPLTPAQQRTLDQLRRPEQLTDWADVSNDFMLDLYQALEPPLKTWAERHPDKELRITKWSMTGCERRRVEDRSQFAWTPEKAQGTLCHQMVQSWFFGPHLSPGELWAAATDRVQRDELSIGQWIRTLNAGTWVEMRERCCSWLTSFAESFPPPSKASAPATEAKLIWRHAPLHCEAKVDVQLGTDVGSQANVVFVELKTGRLYAEHLADLRHYALLRLMKLGTPPRLVALHSISEGRTLTEEITIGSLEAAARRLVDAVNAAVTLDAGRTPTESPSPLCAWCASKPNCVAGKSFLAEREQ